MPIVTRRDVLRSGLAVAGSALIPGYSLAQVNTFMRTVLDDQTPPTIAPREMLLFDFDWKFKRGNEYDAAKAIRGVHGPRTLTVFHLLD